ncbi:MAG TPA: SUF system NifU family Fe-S cluster assembly protein [Thermomicrobiales bacterium]|nr:SUF system NifU family Fe-S cluster assembly protein [Thermomicrobiales bacterium]
MADSLYKEIILDHYRSPRNKGRLNPADYSHEDVNPLCGDEIVLDLRVKDGVISEVAFEGRGCAISQAAASILTEMVEGRPLDEVKAITKDDVLEELGVPISPARMKCALLGLKCLKAGIYGIGHIHDDDL